jgi:hypothetical protein
MGWFDRVGNGLESCEPFVDQTEGGFGFNTEDFVREEKVRSNNLEDLAFGLGVARQEPFARTGGQGERFKRRRGRRGFFVFGSRSCSPIRLEGVGARPGTPRR